MKDDEEPARQLRMPTSRLAKIRSLQNMKRLAQSVSSRNSSSRNNTESESKDNKDSSSFSNEGVLNLIKEQHTSTRTVNTRVLPLSKIYATRYFYGEFSFRSHTSATQKQNNGFVSTMVRLQQEKQDWHSLADFDKPADFVIKTIPR
ncbi:hypothetical protein TKK_0000613 [Trichogramma kaykai]